jgi:hypothetical protein
VTVEPDPGGEHDVIGMDRLTGAGRLARVLQPPDSQRVEDRRQVAARLGEAIPDLAPRGRRLAHDDPGRLEAPQAGSEAGWRDSAQAPGEIGESPRSKQQVAHHEQGPSLADLFEGASHHADVGVDVAGAHGAGALSIW